MNSPKWSDYRDHGVSTHIYENKEFYKLRKPICVFSDK